MRSLRSVEAGTLSLYCPKAKANASIRPYTWVYSLLFPSSISPNPTFGTWPHHPDSKVMLLASPTSVCALHVLPIVQVRRPSSGSRHLLSLGLASGLWKYENLTYILALLSSEFDDARQRTQSACTLTEHIANLEVLVEGHFKGYSLLEASH